MESKSTPNDIANKNRTRIRTASRRKVFGREALRDDIMAKLREASHDDALNSSNRPCYSVIGLYGVAGSGKTAFARYIQDYLNECKEKLFDTIMCIHVSETFSVVDIFHEMLKDITDDRHSNISDREKLEQELKLALHGIRFFLILDDLWVENKNDPQLEELISPLNVGMKGSKILVTARTKFATRALCDGEPIKMPDLDEDQYLTMFMHYALGGTSVAGENFVPVGRLIAKKLHRSPIAAVTVAGRLARNPDVNFWRNTANLDMLSDTMDALWWSYQQLSPDIRRCLEYCNIFPRRFQLRKAELVRLWMAQGFVKTSYATDEMEDVAEGYIQELVSCSFLQPEEITSFTDILTLYEPDEMDFFTIHDLVHELADKVAGSDCFRIENEWSWRQEDWKGHVPRDVRHLFVLNYDEKLITEKILGLENLRTLIILWVESEVRVIEIICKMLPKLRLLAIASSHLWRGIIDEPTLISFPGSISQLKHLRYLAFRTCSTCRLILPRALTELHHIQLLDFGEGEILKFTFSDIDNVPHLRWVRHQFPNIGRLISLQVLDGFRVRNKQGYEVNQLRDLNKLRGRLDISGLENVKSKEEALEANLGAKERVTSMSLSWDGDTARCSPEVESEVLEGLCPHAGLETLHIRNYRGSRYPDWMVGMENRGPKDLQILSLAEWSQLGPAPELEAFPHLVEIHLCNCSWDTLPGNMEHLTSLKVLYIFECLHTRSLPTLPWSLEDFTLSCVNDDLMKYCQTVGHPCWQKIQHIPKKTFDDGSNSDLATSEADPGDSDGTASEEVSDDYDEIEEI